MSGTPEVTVGAAGKSGKSVAEWIRDALTQAAGDDGVDRDARTSEIVDEALPLDAGSSTGHIGGLLPMPESTAGYRTYEDAMIAARLQKFDEEHDGRGSDTVVSVKIKATTGCFHRDHSPYAYRIIDDHLDSMAIREDFAFVKHESGPEILCYMQLAASGMSLLASVGTIIALMLRARSEGMRHDDRRCPCELIVRRAHEHEIHEVIVMRLEEHEAPPSEAVVKKAVEDGLKQVCKVHPFPTPPAVGESPTTDAHTRPTRRLSRKV